MSRVSAIVQAIALALAVACASTALAQTPVADAAMRRDGAEVRRLVQSGADVKAAQADGATALHWAAYYGDASLAALLLEKGADVAAVNRNGSTPLWLASSQGDAAMIEALLKGGADANEALPLGRRPLMLAARSGRVDAVNALLAGGADVNAKEEARGTTALMQAADQGHADVLAVLLEHGADVAAVSSAVMRDGRTAALGKSDDPRSAVRRQVIAILCDQPTPDLGKLQELTGETEDAVLAEAAGGAGGNPCNLQRDNLGFVIAASGGRRGRAPREADGGELTALIYASRTGSIEAARVLLDAGADVNQVSRYGWSPLLAATQNRNYRLGKFLIERGADV
ncbi:MAG TPA: ankyrin repeat domain-containing protein, partial [Gammaproteobacteria bacterium]|nr:ankyrin repeat domain-containing protein [Gammaproteobacteria bacterium]